jgi:hypothetical protein
MPSASHNDKERGVAGDSSPAVIKLIKLKKKVMNYGL